MHGKSISNAIRSVKSKSQRGGSMISNTASILHHYDADAEMGGAKKNDFEKNEEPQDLS
jgi:hypothetical protein